MNMKIGSALALAGLACALSMPLMAANSTSDTSNPGTMNGAPAPSPSGGSSSSDDSTRPSGINTGDTNGTAVPRSGDEAGSGGNSSPGSQSPSGAAPSSGGVGIGVPSSGGSSAGGS